MRYSGTDLESYITEHMFKYEGKMADFEEPSQ